MTLSLHLPQRTLLTIFSPESVTDTQDAILEFTRAEDEYLHLRQGSMGSWLSVLPSV